MAKNYSPVSPLSEVSKIFEKLLNKRIGDHHVKLELFLMFSMVSGLHVQLQIL